MALAWFESRLRALDLRRVVESDDGERLEVTFAPVPRGIWRVAQFAWGFALVHYIFYGVLVALAAYLARDSSIARVLAALAAIAYQPSFWDGSERKLGRPWDALRTHPIWTLSQAYFPVRLLRLKALDPARKYVFGWHPHGILILSRIHVYGGVWERMFPGVPFRVLGASPMFRMPLCREICLWMGAVDAGRTTASRALDEGISVVVYPGGSREIFDTDPNSTETKIYLTKRRGFVRLAMRHGADLVPVFVFGEKRCYRRLNVPVGVRDWLLRALKIPLIVFWGRGFTWYPMAAPQTCVFGEPIPTGRERTGGEEPTEEEVAKMHAEYVDAVVRLFEEHKEAAGYGPEETLRVI